MMDNYAWKHSLIVLTWGAYGTTFPSTVDMIRIEFLFGLVKPLGRLKLDYFDQESILSLQTIFNSYLQDEIMSVNI